MKKTIIAAAVALSLAGVATAAPASRSVAPSTPDRAFTIEGLHDYNLRSSGIRLGASFIKPSAARTFYHEYNVNLGYMTNDSKAYKGDEETYIPLTVGYRANTDLSDKFTLFAGANVGIMKLETEPDQGEGEDTTAPLITVGAGFKFKLSENAHIRVAYEFGKMFISDDEDWGQETDGLRTLSVGIGIAF